jgi:hypothetical protein
MSTGTNVDVVQKLWGFCHALRHDGIDYGDYIEQRGIGAARAPTAERSRGRVRRSCVGGGRTA